MCVEFCLSEGKRWWEGKVGTRKANNDLSLSKRHEVKMLSATE